jgi:hypothetical protein
MTFSETRVFAQRALNSRTRSPFSQARLCGRADGALGRDCGGQTGAMLPRMTAVSHVGTYETCGFLYPLQNT